MYNTLLAISYLPAYYIMIPDVLVQHLKCIYFYDEQLL